MRYLDTHTLEDMGARPRAARPRRFVWLVWVHPHRRCRKTMSIYVRRLPSWPRYLCHGGAT